jgi:tRNA A-37 threonylcarbamoyl transferase component Bud32/predicted nucleotidyltransferase
LNDVFTPDEKDRLVELAKTLANDEVTSVTAYGSKVAGYSRPDSDYDIIVTSGNFSGRVRYKYVYTPIRASALIVRDELFLSDAKRASLGEFVSGRLLNIYLPLLNAGFTREAEIESKKRVIAEAIYELSSQNGEFAQDIIIPLDYFLFDKLHKRASIYPPVVYSYVKTYTCPSALENRASSLDGFREAAKLLAAQGFFEMQGDRVRLVSEKLRSRAFARLLAIFNLTTRGVRQYAVHGYAGRVGLSVVKDEALSKVRRLQQKTEPPVELLRPKELLMLDEGLVVAKTTDMIQTLAGRASFSTYTHQTKTLGEVYSTAKLVTIKGNGEVSYVFKHFADIRSMKWALLNVWAPGMKFSMSPQARMHREYNATRKMRGSGVKTPMILGAAIDDRVLVKEFVEGKLLSKLIGHILKGTFTDLTCVKSYGRDLGIMHRMGFALGDAKAENIVVKGDQLYFTDLEQAHEDGDQAWDIAEFLYYAGKLSLKEDALRVVADAFLEGYVGSNGNENISKALASKYVNPFRALVTPQVMKAIRGSLESHSGRS